MTGIGIGSAKNPSKSSGGFRDSALNNQSQATTGVVRHSPVAILAPNFVTWDMDAYRCPRTPGYRLHPNTRPYARLRPRCTHLMLASAAHLLSQIKKYPRERFVYVPTRRRGLRGAKIMLDEGLIEAGGKPKSGFALHVAPELPLGICLSYWTDSAAVIRCTAELLVKGARLDAA
ncbi:MAG: hypothetical protein CM1200mP18_09570 [Gammaproteobacteria bacterium]|nr:MAG: hypothetical protein CM1200mP18_09570 [Gammaproteobacteria bacterium]